MVDLITSWDMYVVIEIHITPILLISNYVHTLIGTVSQIRVRILILFGTAMGRHYQLFLLAYISY